MSGVLGIKITLEVTRSDDWWDRGKRGKRKYWGKQPRPGQCRESQEECLVETAVVTKGVLRG